MGQDPGPPEERKGGRGWAHGALPDLSLCPLFRQPDQERCLEGSQMAELEGTETGAFTGEGSMRSNNPIPYTTLYTLPSQTSPDFQAKSKLVMLAGVPSLIHPSWQISVCPGSWLPASSCQASKDQTWGVWPRSQAELPPQGCPPCKRGFLGGEVRKPRERIEGRYRCLLPGACGPVSSAVGPGMGRGLHCLTCLSHPKAGGSGWGWGAHSVSSKAAWHWHHPLFPTLLNGSEAPSSSGAHTHQGKTTGQVANFQLTDRVTIKIKDKTI